MVLDNGNRESEIGWGRRGVGEDGDMGRVLMSGISAPDRLVSDRLVSDRWEHCVRGGRGELTCLGILKRETIIPVEPAQLPLPRLQPLLCQSMTA